MQRAKLSLKSLQLIFLSLQLCQDCMMAQQLGNVSMPFL